jgi:hypothetical protein
MCTGFRKTVPSERKMCVARCIIPATSLTFPIFHRDSHRLCAPFASVEVETKPRTVQSLEFFGTFHPQVSLRG